MTDKRLDWTQHLSARAVGSLSQAEKEFLHQAELIAEEVVRMSDQEVSDYIAEHNLQHLIAPERMDGLFNAAVGRAQQRQKTASPTSLADMLRADLRLKTPSGDRRENIVSANFGKRGAKSDDPDC